MGRGSWAKENSAGIFAVALTLTIALATGIYIWRHRGDRDENGPGKIESLIVLDSPRDDGKGELVLVEYVEHGDDTSDWKNWRLTRVDATSGTIRQRTPLPDTKSLRCQLASRDRVWCIRDEHLELREASTFAVVADDAQLKKKSADLNAGIMVGSPMYPDAKAGTLEVETKDGYRVTIDARTLATRRIESRPRPGNRRSFGDSPTGDCSSAKIEGLTEPATPAGGGGDIELAFDGSPRSRLVRRRSGASQGQGTPIGDRTYLQGKVLCRDFTAVTLDGPPGGPRIFVVAEQTSLDTNEAKMRYVAIDETGRQIWQAEDAHGSLAAVTLIDASVLVIRVNGKSEHILGLSAKTGAVLYRYDGTRPR